MLNFYRNLSKFKKVALLFFGGLLLIPIGGVLGLMLGLVATTFIPICCEGGSCHNCFEFQGMIGYEATAFIGFWVGIILAFVGYVILIIYLVREHGLE